jgi:hypothetical protein
MYLLKCYWLKHVSNEQSLNQPKTTKLHEETRHRRDCYTHSIRVSFETRLTTQKQSSMLETRHLEGLILNKLFGNSMTIYVLALPEHLLSCSSWMYCGFRTLLTSKGMGDTMYQQMCWAYGL